jgi:carbon-monoxide dehydrogenase medium subunit
MKPAAFDYMRAASLRDAAAALAQAGEGAKLVAGCQSLGPILNLRLAQPRLLIDITGVPELLRVETTADAVIIGACITTADIEDRRVADRGVPMLPAVAAGIAYRAVRNRGTLGGSLCHADPAADWTAALCALGAECVVTDGERTRRVALDRFMRGPFEVALGSDELLEAVRIPHVGARARWGYYKVCRKAGEFALAIGAVLRDPERDVFRAVIGATQGKPIVVADARELFGNGLLHGAPALDEVRAARLLEDNGIDDPIARTLHLTALRRAAARAATS